MFVTPTAVEIAASRPGDELVPDPDVVMDRAFSVPARPEVVWPWIVQLGKGRAGWYFPRSVERLIPVRRRAIRTIDPQWQALAVGDTIPDYGGAAASFDVARIEPPGTLVYTSRRGRTELTWSITLEPAGAETTRVLLRLRLGTVRHHLVANTVGGLFDLLTVAGMAAGLRERVVERTH